MSAKTIRSFRAYARGGGHLSLVPPAITLSRPSPRRRLKPTIPAPPPVDAPEALLARADHLDHLAAQLLEQSRQLRADAEAMRRK